MTNSIHDFIAQRGITRLVHFTPFINVLGIYEEKYVFPVEMIKERAKGFLLDYIQFNDENRHDGRRNCINLSIQRINYFLFKRFLEKFSCDLWCILEINPYIMEQQGVEFTIANAASSYVKQYGVKSGLEGLRDMFADNLNTGKRIERRVGIPNNCPTSRQAEVLYPGAISISNITGVVVQCEEHYERVKAALEMENVNPLPRIRVCIEDFQ